MSDDRCQCGEALPHRSWQQITVHREFAAKMWIDGMIGRKVDGRYKVKVPPGAFRVKTKRREEAYV